MNTDAQLCLAPKRTREKMFLGPGFSQLDWLRHTNSLGLGSEVKNRATRWLSRSEVRNHNRVGVDAYMAFRGWVYDVTRYLNFHPGGIAVLANFVGEDVTALFEEYHPWVNISMLDIYCVGRLKEDDDKGQRWHEYQLVKRKIDRECRSCVYITLAAAKDHELSLENQKLLEQPGTYVKIRARIGQQVIERPYSPFLSTANYKSTFGHCAHLQKGEIGLFIRVYEDSKIGALLAQEPIGKKVQLEIIPGPFSLCISNNTLTALCRGASKFRKLSDGRIKHICCISAGTGIMPMLQLHDYVAIQPKDIDRPTVSLICAHRSDKDIPFQAIKRSLLEESDGVLKKITTVLSQPNDKHSEAYETGHIDGNVIEKHVSKVQEATENFAKLEVRFFISGPYSFAVHVEKALLSQGWPLEIIFRYD